MNTRNLSIAAIAVVLLLLLLLPIKRQPTSTHTITRSVRMSQDSANVQIKYQPQPLTVKSKLRIRGNRLALDTIVHGDTLHVVLDPDSSITIRLLPAARMIEAWVEYQRRDSIIYERELVTELVSRPWYESPLLVLIGAVLGVLLAMML